MFPDAGGDRAAMIGAVRFGTVGFGSVGFGSVGFGTVGDGGRPADQSVGVVGSGERVDLGRVLTGLRHLPASPEPARVFTDLAAVCVPALADECLIEVTELGGHRYRIRLPGPRPGGSGSGAATSGAAGPGSLADGAAAAPCEGGGAASGSGWSGQGAAVTVSDGAVTARFGSPPGGGPDYTGVLVCVWHHGYAPAEADAALVGVLVDHATALVHRERITNRVSSRDHARTIGLALDGTQRVAAATGILMALYHLTPAQARQLLGRAGDRTHRTLQEVADTVLHTGALPDQHDRAARQDRYGARTPAPPIVEPGPTVEPGRTDEPGPTVEPGRSA